MNTYTNNSIIILIFVRLLFCNFFKILSQNPDYIQTHCNDRRNPFHIACRHWYSYNNPQF